MKCLQLIVFASVALFLSIDGAPIEKNYKSIKKNFGTSLTWKVIDPRSLRFLLVGAWGGQTSDPFYTPMQKAVANGMAVTSQSFQPHFVASVGDHFYEIGPNIRDDPRFFTTFENVFTQPSLQIPWFLIAGNHDWLGGDASAQIDYSEFSSRWIYPNYFYTVHTVWTNGNQLMPVTVDQIFVDTALWCNTTGQNVEKKTIVKYQEWVQEQLQNSTANFLFVLGHLPVYGAEKGQVDCMTNLDQLMRQNKVTAYLGGHEHNLELIQVWSTSANVSTNMFYIVSGAGRSTQAAKTENQLPPDALKFFYGDYFNKNGGFVTLEIQSQYVCSVKFVESTQKILYETTLLGRNQQ